MKTKILQFGEGVFLRAFVDKMIDESNAASSDPAGVAIIKPRPGKSERFDALKRQNGRYHVVSHGIENGVLSESIREISCVTSVIDPFSEPDALSSLIADPDVTTVISNTTEAGIEYKPTACDYAAATFPGRICILLHERYTLGLGGFTFLPCELIENNGDTLKEYVLRYADDWYDGEFADWIKASCRFVNTLVDCIVTGYPADDAKRISKLIGEDDACLDSRELYGLWLLEGEDFSSLPFTGFNTSPDLTPERRRKVRVLNGIHTACVAPALLCGIETIGDMMRDGMFYSYIRALVGDEISESVDEKQDYLGFADKVYDRFRNPYIRHMLSSIALNSTSKWRTRLLPTAEDICRRTGHAPELICFSLACLRLLYETDRPDDASDAADRLAAGDISAVTEGSEFSNMISTRADELYREIAADGVHAVMERLTENHG